jgi:cytochrome P450
VLNGPFLPPKPSSRHTEEQTLDQETEHIIKWSAASICRHVSDNHACLLPRYEHVPGRLTEGPEEIGRVVGASRLPTSSDGENLSELTSVVEEAQRWLLIAPLGLPHVADKGAAINGYRVPNVALLLPAVWWSSRDPAVYHDPEAFKPERFTKPYNELPAASFVFGFGRRICPGKTLSDSTLFLFFAQSLAALSIQKALNADRSTATLWSQSISLGTVSWLILVHLKCEWRRGRGDIKLC